MKICRIATVPFHLLTLFQRQIKSAVDHGHEVVIVASPGAEAEELASSTSAAFHPLAMERSISLYRDLKALIGLITFLRRQRFDLIHSSTPKAGFLAAVAGYLCRVPVRIHVYTGQPWVEMHGITKWLAKTSDRIIGLLSTCCYTDSRSQAAFLVAQGIVRRGSLTVLGEGSVGGVDVTRFNPDLRTPILAAAVRTELRIPADVPVIAFIGRVTKDKGVRELVAAFQILVHKGMHVYLVIVGPLEPERDPLPKEIEKELRRSERIRWIGYSPSPERYLAIADLFCLPSYREGFGTTVIEAAAMGIPTVGTEIVGLVDAVQNGVTGVLVPPKNSNALAAALERMIKDSDLRARMGTAALVRALEHYDSRRVDRAVLDEYDRLSER